MSVLLIVFCFITLFFVTGIASKKISTINDLLLRSVIIFSTLLVLITELTSLFSCLNFTFIVLSWSLVLMINLAYLLIKKEEVNTFTLKLYQEIQGQLQRFTKLDYYILLPGLFLLILVLIQSIVYPPNNWDSMTYHMARISNWISQQSVEHYQTHIFRQIYQPPFAEYVILHVNLLSFGDYFSNTIQLIFLLFSLIAIILIVGLFGLSHKFKTIAIILTITVPEILLQAASTQNDIVASFFVLSTAYFSYKAFKEGHPQQFLLFGLSTGLALLTKGTMYIFLSPILVIFGIAVLIRIYKTRHYTYLWHSMLAAILCIGLNLGHYIRNYNFSSNILGVDQVESKMYSNESMTPLLFLSSIIKNAGLHIGPYPLNILASKTINKLHEVTGVKINSPETNFQNIKYMGTRDFPNHEDFASNTFQFLLTLLSFLLIGIHFFKQKNSFDNKIILYTAIILVQTLLFSLYLKWQPWNTRLETPLFMLTVPFCCYAISLNERYYKLLIKIFPFTMFFALLVILFNFTKPYINNKLTSGNSFTNTRYENYFPDRPELIKEYTAITGNMSSYNYKNIGLVLGWDDWEYPLFYQYNNQNFKPIHINVTNQTKVIPIKGKSIDCIISTTINDSIIVYNGEQYDNRSLNNKVIWLYKKKPDKKNR